MKKFSWKKVISVLLVMALVAGTMRFNGTKVLADVGAAASGKLVDGDSAIQYTVNREAVQEGGDLAEVNLLIVMDSSGSMGYGIQGTQQTRQSLAIQEINTFLSQLGTNVNLVNVVYYNENASQATHDENDGIYYVARPDGGTNIDAGIELAQTLLNGKTNPAMIILSDGEPTFATIGDGGNRIGNGSSSTRNVKEETSAQIDRAVNQGITIYAIRYGNDASIFTDKTNVKNYNAGFSSESLAGEFAKILNEINNILAIDARIEAKLGKFVEYVPSENDSALGIKYENKMLTWNIPNSQIVSSDKLVSEDELKQNVESPNFNFVIIDPSNPTQTDKTEIVKALINYYNADSAKAESEGLKVETQEDGKVKITVTVTVPNATFLYYKVKGVEQGPKPVETFGTLTTTYFDDKKPVTRWTINYLVDDVQKDTETKDLDFDAVFPVETYGYKTPATFTVPVNGQFTRGNVTVNGTTITVPYTEDPKYTVHFFVDQEEVAAPITAYKGSNITGIPSVLDYQKNPVVTDGMTKSYEITGWNYENGEYAGSDVFTKTDADYSVYAVNNETIVRNKFILTINYIDGETGEAIDTAYTQEYEYEAETAAVPSPEKADYYVSEAVVSIGNMPDHNVDVTVKYSKKPVHTVSFWTVKGDEAPVFATKIPVVDHESVEELPAVPGIGVTETPEKTVTVTSEGWDKTLEDLADITGNVDVYAYLNVEEEAQKYTITVNYVHVDPETEETDAVAEAVVEEIACGTPYSYASFETITRGSKRYIIADEAQKLIGGTMPAHDETIDVLYNAVYKVSFVVDGIEALSFDNVVEGSSVDAPAVDSYKKDDVNNESVEYKYTVNGWLDKDGLDVNAEIFANVQSDITVFANNVKGDETIHYYPLTINYISDDGKISKTYTASLKYNEHYNVASEDIEGYTVDKTAVEGDMPAKPVNEVVKYTKKAPTVIIDENTESEPEPEPVENTDPEPVVNDDPEPVVNDDPEPVVNTDPEPKEDPAPVAPVAEPATAPSTPVTITYTLTVKYVYEDGSEAAADVVKSLEPGEAYKVDSPAIEGYTADQAVVEGTMVVFDKTITVVYTKDAEPEEEIEIDPVIETPEAAPEEDDENEEIEEVEENEEEEEEEEIVIDPVVETPEGTPEDEIDLDDVLTPEGLPQTGTASVVIFFGVGAACVILGATMIIKVRRREEEM